MFVNKIKGMDQVAQKWRGPSPPAPPLTLYLSDNSSSICEDNVWILPLCEEIEQGVAQADSTVPPLSHVSHFHSTTHRGKGAIKYDISFSSPKITPNLYLLMSYI